MDQSRIVLPAGKRNIAYGESVGFVGGGRFPLRHVYLVVSRGVENGPGVTIRQRVLYQFAIGDIEFRPRESADFYPPPRRRGAGGRARRPRGAEGGGAGPRFN